MNKIISKLKYDDDEPLYDHVASDEDYATPEQIATMVFFFYLVIVANQDLFLIKVEKAVL